ncbi:hypothetical protein GF336_06380 [Candidatus Woesearchaeota archaeon]|nr:hypothetical protein [Candidatus Woesearchaeota archaeon]
MKKHTRKFREELKKRSLLAISGAFALVIALAWNDAIKHTVNSFVMKLGIPETAYMYKIIIALVITAVCIIGIFITSRYSIEYEK